MKSVKILLFLLLTAFFSGSFQLLAAPKTLDEIESEQKEKEVKKKIKKENEKNAIEEECQDGSAADCFSYAQRFAKNNEEKLIYYTKACDLQYQPACNEVKKAKKAAEAEKTRIAAEEKRKAEAEKRRIKAEEARIAAEEAREKENQFKEELNQAGRKKRLIIATSTLVSGAVIGILGGVSLYGMNEAKKDHDKYYQEYLEAKSNYEAEDYRKKTQNADKKRKTYMALGITGIGVGVALIATGITFYSIEFEGEKEVKKKYNVSFGASPMDGTLQFALNW